VKEIRLQTKLDLRDCEAVFRDAAANMSVIPGTGSGSRLARRLLPGSTMKGSFFTPTAPQHVEAAPPDVSIGREWRLSMAIPLKMQMHVWDKSDFRLVSLALTTQGTDLTLKRVCAAFAARDPSLVTQGA